MFDTHCHLNFKAFNGKVEEVLKEAKKAGVDLIVVPGTDIETSQNAVQVASNFEDVYAAVGVHPHHVYDSARQFLSHESLTIPSKDGTVPSKVKKLSPPRQIIIDAIRKIEKLVIHSKVVAVGEVGLDKHYYNKTKYPNYQVDELFMQLQKEFLKEQIDLAIRYGKSIIFHNREAKKDFLEVVKEKWDKKLEGRVVFHCCEPDADLLNFAKEYKIFIGVDGDITFREDKQEFVKKIPLEQMVLETDSPFLLPEPLRAQKKYLPAGRQVPNEPKNLKLIASFIAEKIGISLKKLDELTEENSKKLFGL